MKIGLIRHFEVIHPYKLLALISSEEFKQWQEGYDTAKTANAFISDILTDDKKNILIVSHGALMWYLRKALLSKGFSGPQFRKAKNGYLYVFEKLDNINE
jgi:broad specificity phosphatase PhoE